MRFFKRLKILWVIAKTIDERQIIGIMYPDSSKAMEFRALNPPAVLEDWENIQYADFGER